MDVVYRTAGPNIASFCHAQVAAQALFNLATMGDHVDLDL
jgi:hypothetical protein